MVVSDSHLIIFYIYLQSLVVSDTGFTNDGPKSLVPATSVTALGTVCVEDDGVPGAGGRQQAGTVGRAAGSTVAGRAASWAVSFDKLLQDTMGLNTFTVSHHLMFT